MDEYIKKYIEYLQEHHQFTINNFDTILSFSRAIIDKCDDDTYFWLINNRNLNLSEKNISPDVITATIFNTFYSMSEDLGKEFSEDVNNGKIRFIDSGLSTSRFIAIRSATTRQLEDYEFHISYTGTVLDIFHLIHEYMHKITEKINVEKNRKKDFVDVFDEASAIFVELVLLNRLLDKYPELKDDLSKIIAKRIIDEIDSITNLYAILKFIEKFNSGLSLKEIKECCEDESFSYDNICECIKSKECGNVGKHFFGLLIALNAFYTSKNLKEDFMKIVNEGRNGKFEFIVSKFPKSPNEITKFVMDMNKTLAQVDEVKTPK